MTYMITTSLGQSAQLVQRAKDFAEKLNVPYRERQKRSLGYFLKIYDGVLLVYDKNLIFHHRDGSQLAFHPDTAMLRIKSKHDPLVELIGRESLTILDTTLGLASDSLVMSYAEHQVTGLESQQLIHLIVSQGLQTFESGNAALDAAMKRIRTLCIDSLTYLKKQSDQAYDIIYCDPMFSEQINESNNLSGLRPVANYSPVSNQWLREAKRVARKKIIIKAHFRDTVFEDFGFRRIIRPNQKFHYGVIDLEN